MASSMIQTSPGPSTLKKSRCAMIRKSASRAISLARSRARSVRSPAARACSRQAMRRNRCSRLRLILWSSPVLFYRPDKIKISSLR